MAALQHELAVVGTAGHLTDPVLRRADGALRLTEVGDRRGFSEAAADLAVDSDRRRSVAAAGRRLYEGEFDWPVIAGAFLAGLADC